MKTKIIIPRRENLSFDFVLKNVGIYSVPDCNDRIVTFSMNEEIFCSIYLFEGKGGHIEALDSGFFDKKNDKFEKLKEIVSITFEKYD